MPTDFEPETPRPPPKRRLVTFLLVAVAFAAAIALANRQVDRTTGVAPDKAPSEKTVGLAPQGSR